MPPVTRFPMGMFIALTTIPALLIGGALWYFSSLLPGCENVETLRLPSPDGVFDLVTFSRDCGTSTGPNVQLAVIPLGDPLPDDAASFVSVGTEADLLPRWQGSASIEVLVPRGVDIYRQDASVAGIAVLYR